MINFKTSHTKGFVNKNELSNNTLSDIASQEKNFLNLDPEINNNDIKLTPQSQVSTLKSIKKTNKGVMTKNKIINLFNSILSVPFFPNRLAVKIIRIINYSEQNELKFVKVWILKFYLLALFYFRVQSLYLVDLNQ